MGDSAIEELFVLVAKTGKDNVTLAIAPTDPRINNLLDNAASQKAWVSELYKTITSFFLKYPHDK